MTKPPGTLRGSLVLHEMRERVGRSLPVDLSMVADLVGVRLRAIGTSRAHEIVLPDRAWYRERWSARATEFARAAALAASLARRHLLGEADERGLRDELIVPLWVVSGRSLAESLEALPLAPRALVRRRWAQARDVSCSGVGMYHTKMWPPSGIHTLPIDIGAKR